MAGDTEDLVLSISADVRQMQRALARITGDTAKATATIQQQFDAAGTKTGAAFDQTAARANRAFTVIEGGARRVGTAIKASSLQTGNLAAQLNDIGVQLAGGTSPFLIALQQGSQINQVLGGGGARGAVTALAGAFTSLINPVSLATIGIIALGGAAVQYFTSMLSDGEKSAETLKREADLIRQVAKEWGDTVPAIKAYADERDRIASETALKEAIDIGITDAYAKAREDVAALAVDVNDLGAKLIALGVAPEIIARIQDEFSALQGKVSTNTATAEDAQRVQAALAAVMAQSGIPAAEGLATAFGNLATAIEAASGAAGEFKIQQQGAILTGRDPAGNPTQSVLQRLDPLGQFDANRDQTNRANATKSQFQIEQEALAKSRPKAASEAEREAKAVADLIEQLEFEQSLIGATNLEREQATALRRAGSAATAEQQEQIKGLIAATYTEKEAIKQQEAAYRSLEQIGTQALNSLSTALSDGKLEASELLNILTQVAQQLIDMPGGLGGLAKLFGFSGGTTGFASEILSGARVGLFHKGGVAGAHTMARTVHPGVFAGAPRYHGGGIAGIRPGEVPAILQRGERIIPNGSGGRGGGTQVNIIDNAGVQKREERKRGPDGREMVNVILERVKEDFATGGFDKPFQARFGAQPIKTVR